jgi:hypothetical protein
MAARLPTVGGDDGNWGQILNDFLTITHKTDGTLKDNSVTSNVIVDGSVTVSKMSSGVQTSLGKADTALQTVDKTAVGLGNVDNTSDINKPVSTATQTALNAKVTSVVGQTGVITGAQIAADAALTATFIQQGALVYDVMDHGATGLFSGNDTTALQNAVDTVAEAGGGVVYLRPHKWFNTDGIKMRGNVSLVGGGSSTTLAHRANATQDLISLYDYSQMFVTIRNMNINGNSTNQVNPVDGIHLDQTGANGSSLPNHRIQDVYIYGIKGNGIYLGAITRATSVTNVGIYKADGYGLWLAGADSRVSNVDIGQSGLCGVYATGGAYQLDNIKSWYSGRIDTANGDGFLIAGPAIVGSNLYSQDSAGNGFHVFRSGTTITGLVLTGCMADNANGSHATYSAYSFYNVTGAYVTGSLRTYTPGGTDGVPLNAVTFTGGCSGCDVTIVGAGQSSWFALGGDLGANTLRAVGRESKVYALTWNANLSIPNPWFSETYTATLTGATAMVNPGATPAGVKLRYILTQDAVGGHTVTWGTNFVITHFSMNATASATSVATFISNGTKWYEI